MTHPIPQQDEVDQALDGLDHLCLVGLRDTWIAAELAICRELFPVEALGALVPMVGSWKRRRQERRVQEHHDMLAREAAERAAYLAQAGLRDQPYLRGRVKR